MKKALSYMLRSKGLLNLCQTFLLFHKQVRHSLGQGLFRIHLGLSPLQFQITAVFWEGNLVLSTVKLILLPFKVGGTGLQE